MATVANYTPDTIKWSHVGLNGTIKPDQVVEMADGRARHILNKFGAIGLVQLNFGDDPEEKKKVSMALWRSFWERMIENHNQSNEDSKEKGNRYTKPTPELEEKAKLFGLELLRPWRVDKKDNKEIEELKNENKSLKSSLETMQDQMTRILEMMGNKPKSDDADKALTIVVENNRNKYKRLGASNMKQWLDKNWDDFLKMPEANRLEIQARYDDLYGEPFPEMLA